MAGEKDTFLDRLGPTLTSALIVAFLSATSLGAVALRDLVISTNVDLTNIKSEFARHREEFDKFRQPGPRFTREDGDKLQAEVDALENRIRIQETRPPRVGEEVAKLHSKIHEIELKQAEICERIKTCYGLPSTNSSSSSRNSNKNY